MTPRERPRKKSPDDDVYILQDESDVDDADDQNENGEDPTIIETQVAMDWIEYNPEDEPDQKPKSGVCRVTFHVDLPERIAQHLFAHHVQDGQLTVEFHPTAPALRRRDALVKS